jgi:hypothetical protein
VKVDGGWHEVEVRELVVVQAQPIKGGLGITLSLYSESCQKFPSGETSQHFTFIQDEVVCIIAVAAFRHLGGCI